MEKDGTRALDRAELRDIRDVSIDVSRPREERLRDYIRQIGDPYRYLDDGVVVEIGYADTSVTLQDRLLSYARSLSGPAGNL